MVIVEYYIRLYTGYIPGGGGGVRGLADVVYLCGDVPALLVSYYYNTIGGCCLHY